MSKRLVLFVCAVFAATTCARSPGASVFRIPVGLENNEIDRDMDSSMSEEKLMALLTNELKPRSNMDLSKMTTDKRVELETNELNSQARTILERPHITSRTNVEHSDDIPTEAHPNDMETSDSQEQSGLGLIDQSKAPTTAFEYVMEFLYGLCQWVYKKFIA